MPLRVERKTQKKQAQGAEREQGAVNKHRYSDPYSDRPQKAAKRLQAAVKYQPAAERRQAAVKYRNAAQIAAQTAAHQTAD
jgi:hypothetical protein